MELFYSCSPSDGLCRLSKEEAFHCFKVMRHRVGDHLNVIDGSGSLFECEIVEQQKEGALLRVLSQQDGFGLHNYVLNMAVAPTKNIDRYEWFLEKATEIGADAFYPVIGEHSERKVIKSERCEKILLSAVKQSLKGRVPSFEEPLSVEAFIKAMAQSSKESASTVVNLIAYCGVADKLSIAEALKPYISDDRQQKLVINILIGPEGDFSQKEVDVALACGFKAIHLGPSRLRTESAALLAVASVYNLFI